MKEKQIIIERSIDLLREHLVGIMNLVNGQLKRSRECIIDLNYEVAEDIKQTEKIVNKSDSIIIQECSNIIALYAPVASDLRFIISAMFMSSNLERIGDLCEGIGEFVRKENLTKPFNEKLLECTNTHSIFALVEEQINNSISAFLEADTDLSRKVLRDDLVIKELNKKSIAFIDDYYKEKKPSSITSALYLFTTLNKLERISGLCSNIAEETIYYLEGEDLKHKKIGVKKKKIKEIAKNIMEDTDKNE